jgi:hypothetical protein
MRPCTDKSAFDWIQNGRLEPNPLGHNDPAWIGNTVLHLIPNGFEAYAKIFHQLEARFDDPCKPLSIEEKNILKIGKCAPLADLVERHRSNRQSRVWWSEAASILGVQYTGGLDLHWLRAQHEPGCWTRHIIGPGDGGLEPDEYDEIAGFLDGEEGSRECFFRLPEMPFILTDQTLLFQGAVDEVTSIPAEGPYRFPEYWWSTTHQWCVCSDYDLFFTIVGGHRRLISKILNSSLLESIEIDSDLRIDSFTPIPSAR